MLKEEGGYYLHEPKSKLSKLFNFILLLIIAVSLIMWIFNLTFSLPVNFAEMVEDNAETSVNAIERIEVEMSGQLPDKFTDFSDYIYLKIIRILLLQEMK